MKRQYINRHQIGDNQGFFNKKFRIFDRLSPFKKFKLGAVFFSLLFGVAVLGNSFPQADAAIFYTNNFDADTVGVLPTGWTNIGSPTWQVGTSKPVSGARNLEDPVFNVAGVAVYTGASAVADSSGQISQVVQLNGSGQGANTGLFLRVSSDGNNGYLFAPLFHTGTVVVFERVAGSYNPLNTFNGTASGSTFTNNDVALLKAEVSGTTLRWKMWKSTDPEPGSWAESITNASVSAAGYIGLFEGLNNTTNAGTISTVDDINWGSVGSNFASLTAGTISLVSKTSTTVNLSATAATGGTAPYTYQWYRSTTSGFTPGPGNLLSGQTALTLADTGLTATTTYYYKIRATDDTSAAADSTQFSVTTDGIATSYTFTGPTSGLLNANSTNFTITPNGEYTGTITPQSNGSGTFTPSSLTWTATSDAKTFVYQPTSTSGSPHTISASATPSLTNSSGTISFTVYDDIFYKNDFDDEAGASLPTGWTNVGAADWKVGTTGAISAPNSFTDPVFHVGGEAVYTGSAAVADSSGQISQRVNLDGSGHGANSGIFLRVSADSNNGYLFVPTFVAGAPTSSSVVIFKRVSGAFTMLNSSSTARSWADGDTAITKAEVTGTTLRWKMWKSNESEPAWWTFSMTDASVSAAGYIGVYQGFNNNNQGSTVSSLDDLYWGIPGAVFTSTPATGFTFTGPTTGGVNLASTNFTVTPNGAYSGTITPNTTGAGTFSPTSLTFNDSATPRTFTYTPTTISGSPHTISVTPNPSITNLSGSVSYTVTTPPNTIAVNNGAWAAGRSPYNWFVSGSSFMQAVNPGAYFKVKFTGTSAALEVDVSDIVSAGALAKEYPQIAYRVDGGSLQTYQLESSDTSVSLASGLSDTTHDLEVIFLSSDPFISRWDGTMSLKVTGLTLDSGKTLSAATLRPSRLLAFGDSITEGAWILGNVTDLTNYSLFEESTSAYIAGVASDLNAEYGTAAFGGQSWESPFNADVPSLVDAWDFYFASNSRLSGGLFSPEPDFITVNMGTNGGPSSGTVLSNWLTAVRAAAGDDAKIFVIVPFNGSGRTNITAGFNSYVSASSDDHVFLIDLGTDGVTFSTQNPAYSFDGLHPNTDGHAELRTLVSEDIEDALESLDITAPSVAVTVPTDGATVSGATVTLTATASDNVGIAGVQFKLDGATNIGAEVTTSPFTIAWDSTAVADGAHTITAVARDLANNTATSTAITITVDNIPEPSSGGGGGNSHPKPSTPTTPTSPGLPPQPLPQIVILPYNVRDGQLLQFTGNPTIYLVKADGLHPFDTFASFEAYQNESGETVAILDNTLNLYTISDVLAQQVLDDGFDLQNSFPTGTLVDDNGTIYLIVGKSKIGFTTYAAFTGLGYKSWPLVNGMTSLYQPHFEYLSDPMQRHPISSWVFDGGSIYYFAENNVVLKALSYDTWIANRGSQQTLLEANTADVKHILSRESLPALKLNDPLIIK